MSSSVRDSSPTERRGLVTGILGLGLAIALLVWTLHDISFDDFAARVQQANLAWFCAAVLLAFLTLPIKVLRWQELLRATGDVPSFGALWHAAAIGLLVNNLLPARAGEFASAYAARELCGRRFSTTFASIVVERVFDGITIIALLAITVIAGGADLSSDVGGVSLLWVGVIGCAAFGGVFLFLCAIAKWPQFFVSKTTEFIAKVTNDTIGERVAALGDGLLLGLGALQTLRRLSLVLSWSILMWLVNTASIWAGFVAFGLGASWHVAVVLQVVIAISVILPPAPGFFGVFEAANRVVLTLYGVVAAAAVSFAVSYHMTLFVISSLIGLWSLWRSKILWSQISRASRASEAP
ncbi:MAG: lysylphosphatidylglycerol synthase transmembrane domain-containing protein [Pseudomonadota bacterium]